MMKKIKKHLLILCIVFPVLVYADDGSLKLDTDIITNSTQDTVKNRIESKYAPNLFLNRTQKVVDQRTQTTKELLQGAEQTIFTDSENHSIYRLETTVVKTSLFNQYTIEEKPSFKQSDYSIFKDWLGSVFTSFFLLFMVFLGIYLGRKWHGLRKNKVNSRV